MGLAGRHPVCEGFVHLCARAGHTCMLWQCCGWPHPHPSHIAWAVRAESRNGTMPQEVEVVPARPQVDWGRLVREAALAEATARDIQQGEF